MSLVCCIQAQEKMSIYIIILDLYLWNVSRGKSHLFKPGAGDDYNSSLYGLGLIIMDIELVFYCNTYIDFVLYILIS